MNNIKIGKMDVNTAWEIPWKCWELMKVNYMLALGLSFILIAIVTMQNIPLVGSLISGPMIMIWTIGVLFVAKDWEAQKSSSFSQFIENATDLNKLKPLLPLFIVSIFSGAVAQQAVTMEMSGFILFLITIFSFSLSFLINLMLCQISFHPETSLKIAFDNSIKTIRANFIPLVFVWIFYWLLAVVAAILLVLPLIFAFLPAATSFTYIIYRVTLEGLELETTPESEQ